MLNFLVIKQMTGKKLYALKKGLKSVFCSTQKTLFFSNLFLDHLHFAIGFLYIFFLGSVIVIVTLNIVIVTLSGLHLLYVVFDPCFVEIGFCKRQC